MGDNTRSQVTALNYDVSVGDVAYVSAFALATRNSGSRASSTVGLQITFPLGERQSAMGGLSETDGRFDGRAEFRRDAPFGTGLGYRATVTPNEPTRADGQITWRNEVNTVTAEAADTTTGAAARVLASGSLAYAGGKTFAARELGDAFGVASVSAVPGVRVYQENHLVGRTDSEGRIALPELRAYQENRISIDPADVPLDAQVSRDAQTLVPPLHGAAMADFAVTATRGALVLLVDDAGKPLKPGIAMAVDGRNNEAFTGYGGEVFVAHAHDGAVLEARSDGQRCIAKLGTIPPGTTQPRIGPVTCRGAP